MKQELAIEMAPFTVASGVTTDVLLEASDRLERDFLSKTDGYLGRILAHKDSNEWADIVFWKSPEHAAKAMEAVASSDACQSYFSCMVQADHDDAGNGVTLFQSLKAYGSIRL